MNALPTATACALPHGQAHGIPRAIQSGSVAGTVHAKRSEVKGPEVKTPEVKTPDLKGPEVKMNQPWSPSHHGVQKVDASDSAPVVAPSPVTTPDAMMSLTAIEHLDFEPEVPCDGSWDDELCQCAAFGVVVALCRGCREGGRSFICRRCWAECQSVGWLCPSCDRPCEPRFIRLVVTIR